MSAYYNEIDAGCARWLRNLIAAGHIADGEVDERDIRDVVPADLVGFTQCHFFAGIGGWSLALRLADWPDDRPVWTGSCPCQPFSSAGQGAGFADERHLWPAFFHQIDALLPGVVFGEQTSGPAGRTWLDLVSDDLEGIDYATGAVDLAACGVGAPHIRNRLYWVGDAAGTRRAGPEDARANRDDAGEGARSLKPERTGVASGLGDPHKPRSQGRRLGGNCTDERSIGAAGMEHWSDIEWISCSDGRTRPVPTERALFPLAKRLPGDVGLIRGSGNAIVPQLGAEFVKAWM